MDKPRIRQVDSDASEVTVKVGELFFIGFHRHGSVGEDAEFEIEDESVIEFVRTDSEYLHPERMKPGMTGGDAERCKWIFRAKSKGQTRITVRDLFRFKVESENVIVINVDE